MSNSLRKKALKFKEKFSKFVCEKDALTTKLINLISWLKSIRNLLNILWKS